MKSTIAVLFLVFATAASANRMLLQGTVGQIQQAAAGLNLTGTTPTPAPAPGPSSCPAKQSPSSTCIAQATAFQSSCSDFITALNGVTQGKVTATTDSQISALVDQLTSNGKTPGTACCTVATSLLSQACACDTSVQAVAKAKQNLSPSEFQTVGKVFLQACGKPACTDTCQLSA